jgi:hypothetical protein
MIQYWDDDDVYLSHRLSLGRLLMSQEVAGRVLERKATREEKEWRWQFDGTVRLNGARPMGTLTTTRSAIREAGGFPAMAQLQDVNLCAQMMRQGMLTNVPRLDAMPSVIYRRHAGEGIKHVTDSRQPNAGRLSDAGVENMMQGNLAERLASGQEPSGRIELSPHWDTDYSSVAAAAWEALP